MKRPLLALFSLFAASVSLHALDVSTEPQYKKALLEEFTGINCGNCPDGHAIAAKIQLAQPDNVFIMSVHAGHYAEPGVGDPDFLTEEGTILNNYFEVYSYPCGMINRKVFDNGASPVLSRGMWIQYAREICHEISPVNLAVECDYDEYKSLYTVTVAGYYTSTQTDCETNNLCVALVQNNIQGYQAGSGVSDDYMHQHVLRDYFTPVWGDPISEITEGSRFEKTYQLTLPQIIGNKEVEPSQLEVLAFVTTGEGGEVLNVASGRANPALFDLPLAAEISSYKIPISPNYGFDFLELYMENKGSVAITDATFSVTLNGVTTETTWTGEIPAMTKQAITIDIDWSDQTDENLYAIRIEALNGKPYDGTFLSGIFGGITPVTTSAIVKFKTDYYFSDNTFTLKDSEGNIVKTFGNYEDGVQAVYEEPVTFEKDAIYCFEITDSWGNGILSPRGNFKLYDTESNLLAQNMDITNHGFRLFVKASLESGIDEVESSDAIAIHYANDIINITAPEDFVVTVYNMTGLCAYSASDLKRISTAKFAPGLYIVKVSSSAGTQTQKITIN